MRQCRYTYTAAERLEKGRALADEYQSLDATNNDLERTKKQFKARIDASEAVIANLAEQVRSGYELRETLCFWKYNTPSAGRKTLVRADTMENVCEEEMSGKDLQMVLESVDAEAAAAAGAGGVLALPVGDDEGDDGDDDEVEVADFS